MTRNRSIPIATVSLWLGVMADCATTEAGVRRHGLDFEANPLVRFLLRRIGMPGIVALLSGLCFSLHRSLRILEAERPRTAHLLLWPVGVVTATRYVVVAGNVRWLLSRRAH